MHERAVAEAIALFAIKKKVKRSENIPMQLLCEK